MVALDRHRGSTGEADALDHVGIERPLRQELGTADFGRFGIKHVDEGLADELALGLGVGDAGKATKELFRRIDVDQRDVVVVAEQPDDLFSLAGAQQPGVDEDAG